MTGDESADCSLHKGHSTVEDYQCSQVEMIWHCSSHPVLASSLKNRLTPNEIISKRDYNLITSSTY